MRGRDASGSRLRAGAFFFIAVEYNDAPPGRCALPTIVALRIPRVLRCPLCRWLPRAAAIGERLLDPLPRNRMEPRIRLPRRVSPPLDCACNLVRRPCLEQRIDAHVAVRR